MQHVIYKDSEKNISQESYRYNEMQKFPYRMGLSQEIDPPGLSCMHQMIACFHKGLMLRIREYKLF